jgi:hypothetical protein
MIRIAVTEAAYAAFISTLRKGVGTLPVERSLSGRNILIWLGQCPLLKPETRLSTWRRAVTRSLTRSLPRGFRLQRLATLRQRLVALTPEVARALPLGAMADWRRDGAGLGGGEIGPRNKSRSSAPIIRASAVLRQPSTKSRARRTLASLSTAAPVTAAPCLARIRRTSSQDTCRARARMRSSSSASRRAAAASIAGSGSRLQQSFSNCRS